MPEDLTPERRLRIIVKAFEWSGEPMTVESVSEQFNRETGRDAPAALVRAAISGAAEQQPPPGRSIGSIDDLF